MNSDKIYFERKIIDLLSKDNVNNCSFHFDYENMPVAKTNPPTESIYVSVVSYNPTTETTFLVCKANGENEEDAVRHAHSTLKSAENSKAYKNYTVEWSKKNSEGTRKLEVSYFFAKDEFEVLEKLYYGLNQGNILFYSMKLNPIS